MTDPATFLAEFAGARAEHVVDTPGGFAVLSPTHFPHAHDHNALWVTGPVEPGALLAAADDVLGGLEHRRVEVDAPTAALTAALVDAGYEAEDDVVMIRRRDPDADRPAGTGVIDLDAQRRVEVAERVWAELGPEVAEDVRSELAARARTALTAAHCTFLGVVDDGDTVEAHCDLFVRGDTAQIEEVFTLAPFRGRGHASRLVRAAAERAVAGDPDRVVFLVADADDWPRALYGRLGFDVTGTRTVWSRT